MKKVFVAVACIFFCKMIHAQETKNIVLDANAEVRTINSFTSIEVGGAIDLYLSQGAEDAVAISATNSEAKSSIKTDVSSNGVLHIYFDSKGGNWKSWGNTKSKAYVTFKTLKRITASGACNVVVTESIKVQNLKLEFSGASDFKGDITSDNLAVEASGASHVKIIGKAAMASIEASGASGVRGYDLKVDICRAQASGASSIRITVNKEFKAEASGGSYIYYKGEGIAKDISTSGAATIKKEMAQ